MEEMSGESLVTLAALLAVQLAQGRSVAQLELLGNFFTALADNLLLIAGQLPESTESCGDALR